MQEATMSAPCECRSYVKKTHHAARGFRSAGRYSAPFFASFSPSPTPFFFFAATPCRVVPHRKLARSAAKHFFHGHGCTSTCGMRYGSPVESFLMTGKTTDHTWMGVTDAERRDQLYVFRISFLFVNY